MCHICLCAQQKLKEEREAKRAQLDDRHGYLLVTVADSLGLDKSEVEDAILEGNQVSARGPHPRDLIHVTLQPMQYIRVY